MLNKNNTIHLVYAREYESDERNEPYFIHIILYSEMYTFLNLIN
jgi:hypothetical protein